MLGIESVEWGIQDGGKGRLELTSSHGHIKSTVTYGLFSFEKKKSEN